MERAETMPVPRPVGGAGGRSPPAQGVWGMESPTRLAGARGLWAGIGGEMAAKSQCRFLAGRKKGQCPPFD